MLKSLVSEALKTNNILETFVKKIANLEKKNLKELRADNLTKGNIWEQFCVEYLRLKDYKNVQLLRDIPPNCLQQLGLSNRDMGIDIIATKNEKNVAVQCKFRAKHTVTWRDIATFEALCARSGPWFEHIVMTNSSFVHREGSHIKDVNMVKSTFEKMERHEWCVIAGYGHGNTIGGTEQSREMWLSRFDHTCKNSSEQTLLNKNKLTQ